MLIQHYLQKRKPAEAGFLNQIPKKITLWHPSLLPRLLLQGLKQQSLQIRP